MRVDEITKGDIVHREERGVRNEPWTGQHLEQRQQMQPRRLGKDSQCRRRKAESVRCSGSKENKGHQKRGVVSCVKSDEDRLVH